MQLNFMFGTSWKNFKNIAFYYAIICYPVLFTCIIDLAENTLFFMGLCSLLCALALYCLMNWFLSNMAAETLLQEIETAVAAIFRASEFNFPHPVEWEKVKARIELIALSLDSCFQDGFVSKILRPYSHRARALLLALISYIFKPIHTLHLNVSLDKLALF